MQSDIATKSDGMKQKQFLNHKRKVIKYTF